MRLVDETSEPDGEPDELEVVGVEVEERGGAACREAGELHERLVDVHEGLRAVEGVDAQAREGEPVALLRARANDAEAGAVGDLEADEGAQGAVSGFRAGVEVETAQAAEAGHVVGAGRPRREGRRAIDAAAALRPIFVFEAGPAADAQAGVGARNVEEACSVGGADANVFNRRGLLDGKVGGLSPSHRAQTRG